MASLARYSARLVGRRMPDARSRGFRTATRNLAAQNFTMPALSPTMTEGNIAKWNVKEGDSFAAGDVLLEIETDKATMDVEAQDDGVLVKIMQGDGSKAVSVGTRIAVLAEAGDDVASLEIPPDDSAATAQQQKKSAPPPESESKSSERTEASESKKPAAGPKVSSGDAPSHVQKYPLLPSVAQLVAENGLDEAAVASITPTGPNGRLLKGDVLAHLGSISAGRPAAVSDLFKRLAHLDLSNVKVAEKKAVPAPTKDKAETTTPVAPKKLEVAVPVSLGKVIEVQRKIEATLGVFMPLSTFIARAAEMANDDLPPSAVPPTTDELFNQILGLDKFGGPAKLSRGRYMPQVAALPPPPTSSFGRPAPKKQDIIDILTGPSKPSRPAASSAVSGLTAGTNLFSLTVPKAETQRATVFLERVKVMLETEPGRLVL